MSAILGIGSGLGLVVGGLIDEHLNWHWLFWIPLPAMVLAAACTWRTSRNHGSAPPAGSTGPRRR